MRRKVAIAFAVGMALFGMLIPAFVAEEVRNHTPSRTYTEYPPAPSLTPWVVDELPSRGLSEPRKDRP